MEGDKILNIQVIESPRRHLASGIIAFELLTFTLDFDIL
jgi:hypothetical protein